MLFHNCCRRVQVACFVYDLKFVSKCVFVKRFRQVSGLALLLCVYGYLQPLGQRIFVAARGVRRK